MASILRRVASAIVPPAVKRWRKRLLRAYRERFRRFTPADLTQAVRRLGAGPGDVLMVHSAFDSFLGFHGGPAEVVRALQDTVGPDGTLIMPTLPFRNTAVEYALTDPVFDARLTVSRMGLITEAFRRSPGVVRSNHPTHSVAAWGRRAQAVIAGHERSETPCGRETPYGRLLSHDGKILLAGVSPSTMTFCYFVAEALESQLPIPVLTDARYPMRWRDPDGTVHTIPVRLFSLRLDHDLTPLVRELKRRGQWREGRAGRGGLRLVLVHAQDVFQAAEALAGRGQFIRERPG